MPSPSNLPDLIKNLNIGDGLKSGQTTRNNQRLCIVQKGLPESPRNLSDDEDVLDNMLDNISSLMDDFNVQSTKPCSVAMIEKDICEAADQCSLSPQSVSSENPDAAVSLSPQSAASTSFLDTRPQPATDSSASDMSYSAVAQRYGMKGVMELSQKRLRDGALSNLFDTSLKATNALGHTATMVFVSQQDLPGVNYCCLFMSTGDDSLFPALSEAALLPSDEIFYAILHTMQPSGSPTAATWLCDRKIEGWQFLNSQLHGYQGQTLEQLLCSSNQVARLQALRHAMGTWKR